MHWARTSEKQVNKIYVAWRNGDIKANRSLIDAAYEYARAAGRDGSGSICRRLDNALQETVDALFRRDFARAQECIDAFAAADSDSKREREQIRADAARYAAMWAAEQVACA